MRDLLRQLARPLGSLLASEPVSVGRTLLAREYLAHTRGPIILGPWLSEVGFELLYWIPFLRWVREHPRLAHRRAIVISRGGVQSWYRGLATDYVELFDLYTLDEFRARNEQRRIEQGEWKHWTISSWERAIVTEVKAQFGLEHVAWLHPSVMYKLFRAIWLDLADVDLAMRYARHEMIPPEEPELQLDLPESYIAVKLYWSGCLPDTRENRERVQSIIQRLSARVPVVMLNTGLEVDDHRDFAGAQVRNVHMIDHLLKPSDNLAVQTHVVRRARAFYGTYGGFSYLAPYLGVDSIAVYSEPHFLSRHHLDLARRVTAARGGSSFVALDVSDFDALDLLIREAPGGASAAADSAGVAL